MNPEIKPSCSIALTRSMTQVKENSANTVKTMQTFSTVADGYCESGQLSAGGKYSIIEYTSQGLFHVSAPITQQKMTWINVWLLFCSTLFGAISIHRLYFWAFFQLCKKGPHSIRCRIQLSRNLSQLDFKQLCCKNNSHYSHYDKERSLSSDLYYPICFVS
jgi:hypothetical protein